MSVVYCGDCQVAALTSACPEMIAGGAVPSLRQLLSSSDSALQAVLGASQAALMALLRVVIRQEMSAAVLGNLCPQLCDSFVPKHPSQTVARQHLAFFLCDATRS